jgi:hypothetical protein
MLARSTFPNIVPDAGSVTIIKQRRSRWDDSPDFYLASITHSERKLADMSLAALSIQMTAEENGIAASLNDILWLWLSGRTSIPRYEKVAPFAAVTLLFSGPAEDIVAGVETLINLEPVSSIGIGPAFLQGEPRRPEIRWLLDLGSTADVASARADFRTWNGPVPPEAVESVDRLLTRVSKVYGRRADMRRSELRRLATAALGDGADEWLHKPGGYGKASPLASVEETYQYEDDLQWLKEAKPKPRSRYRSWRASEG